MSRRWIAALALGCGLALGAPQARAEIDGHGPDAWRVTGVAADDVLNMRMGPGTGYLVIDSLAPDARGLEQITCVPLLLPAIRQRLTPAQRADLPQRWCLMRTADLGKAGWVAQRFLAEDTGPAPGPGDPLIAEAVRLVADLYAAFETQRHAGENPFAPPLARAYFQAALIPDLAGQGGEVLYDAQDFQGRITRIAPDAAQPMLRGMITINADFINFGLPGRAVFRLRADPAQPGAPVRIFRVEHDGWHFPP
ncbi:MAG: hypothetical protein EP318_07205 [Rhodobacteraceae bacterium]|nr:MAG: hypothetical protein EP318_07205 [Paracoccaceae bacterium]